MRNNDREDHFMLNEATSRSYLRLSFCLRNGNNLGDHRYGKRNKKHKKKGKEDACTIRMHNKAVSLKEHSQGQAMCGLPIDLSFKRPCRTLMAPYPACCLLLTSATFSFFSISRPLVPIAAALSLRDPVFFPLFHLMPFKF